MRRTRSFPMSIFLEFFDRLETEILVPSRIVHVHPMHSPIRIDLPLQNTQSMQVRAMACPNGSRPGPDVEGNDREIDPHRGASWKVDKVSSRDTVRGVAALFQPAYCQMGHEAGGKEYILPTLGLQLYCAQAKDPQCSLATGYELEKMVGGNLDRRQSGLYLVVILAHAYTVKVDPRSWLTTREVNHGMSGTRFKAQQFTKLFHGACLLRHVVGLVIVRVKLNIKPYETMEC